MSGAVAGVTQALVVWSADTGIDVTGADLVPGGEETVLGALVLRALVLSGAPIGVVAALPMVLLGLWLARRSVLEEPARHLPALRRTVTLGLAVSMIGGLPMALAVSRVWEPGPLALLLPAALHEVTGVAGGLAFAAAVAWLVAVRSLTVATLGPVGSALRAVGTRSLTCYLLQSVLFVLPLRGWAGGLGADLGSAQVVAWAIGAWLVTVVVAVLLERAGRRGPAETLYRRLVYRTR